MTPLPRNDFRSKPQIGTSSQDRRLVPAMTLLMVISGILCAWAAKAMEAESHASAPKSALAPCAVLKDFNGEMEILDSSRTRLTEPMKDTGIPCGGWVSVTSGWAQIKHRDGFLMRLAAGTFAQIAESASGKLDQSGGVTAPLTIYRGQACVAAGNGSEELWVVTANALVRMKKGTAFVSYLMAHEETSVISVAGSALIENRFQPEKSVTLKPGQVSTLNFKLLRVIPSTPRPIAMASLRDKFNELQLSDRERAFALAAIQEHPEQKDSQKNPKAETASASQARARDYSRGPASAQSAEARKMWVRKMTAGEDVGESILFPGELHGKAQNARVTVEDPATGLNQKQQRDEDAERKRLIEELSRIRDE